MNLGVWRMKDFMQSMCNVFVEVYAYIYIYGRVSWYYILSITSQGAPKSTRAHIYIYICVCVCVVSICMYNTHNTHTFIYIYRYIYIYIYILI